MEIWENCQEEDLYGEIWKPALNYEDHYLVSNLGRVRSLSVHRILKQRLNQKGYPILNLCKGNKKFGVFVHRFIATTFIPNFNNKPFINHKNGVKIDNNIENLEWVTCSENHVHAFRQLGRAPSRPGLGKTGEKCYNSKVVLQYDLNNNLIKEFPGVEQASRELGTHGSNISTCCLGKTKSSCGYIWRYKYKIEPKRIILQLSLDEDIIKEWPSISEAARQLNLKKSSISMCCKGHIKTHSGFKWRFKNK